MNSRHVMRSFLSFLLLIVICITTAQVNAQADGGEDAKVFIPLITNYTTNTQPSGPGSCLTDDESELGRLINEYRASVGLPAAPLSKSLTMVAQYHVLDLQTNYPARGSYGKDSRGLPCNMHTWSDKGHWTPVCYTSDHQYASGMWYKPGEITRGVYTGIGFEIAAGYWGKDITPQDALNLWKNSPGHNNVIVENGDWQGSNWPAMGIGMSDTYAVVWFSSTADAQGSISTCP